MTELLFPKTSAEIIALTEAQKRLLDNLLENLSDVSKNAAGTITDWAVKDHLSHLAVWANGITALLNKKPRWQAMGQHEAWIFAKPHFDDINAVIYLQNKHLNFDESLMMFQEAHAALIATLNDLSEEDLQQGYSYYQPHEPGKDSGDPITRWIAGNSYEHYEEHLPWIQERIARDEGK